VKGVSLRVADATPHVPGSPAAGTPGGGETN
jgi:hypothetical protein